MKCIWFYFRSIVIQNPVVEVGWCIAVYGCIKKLMLCLGINNKTERNWQKELIHQSNIRLDLADTAMREPESVCVETFSISIQRYQALLDKLLRTGWSKSSWYLTKSWTFCCSVTAKYFHYSSICCSVIILLKLTRIFRSVQVEYFADRPLPNWRHTSKSLWCLRRLLAWWKMTLSGTAFPRWIPDEPLEYC